LSRPPILRFNPGRRDTAIPVQPESGPRARHGGLPAWRRGSPRGPGTHVPITIWTESLSANDQGRE